MSPFSRPKVKRLSEKQRPTAEFSTKKKNIQIAPNVKI